MYRVYEIFEVLPSGARQKVAVVSGLPSAKAKLHELANNTPNECFAADTRTRQIVALLNVPPLKWRASIHIFQISYDEQLGPQRAEFLKSRGYSVLSVIGNDAAKVALGSTQNFGLFIVGQAALEQARHEMVLWLKAKYPKVKILALNPPDQQLPSADYNITENGPESLLPVISQVLGNSAGNPGSNQASTTGA